MRRAEIIVLKESYIDYDLNKIHVIKSAAATTTFDDENLKIRIA